YRLPHPFLPREAFVVVANGGSDYLDPPDHDPAPIRTPAPALPSHGEFGAIFVDARYADIPGTPPLPQGRLENADGPHPAIVVGCTCDENAVIRGCRGIEFEGIAGSPNHGMHGSFSPVDVHSPLLAIGPDFAEGYVDELPSGNVDVAPTAASIL